MRRYALGIVVLLCVSSGAHGLAMDCDSGRLFSACANQVLIVVDVRNGQSLGRASIGRGTDAVVFDPIRERVYVSSSEGFVSIIDVNAEGVPLRTTDVQTRVTGRTMAMDPVTETLFVPAADLELDWEGRGARFAADGLRLFVYVPIAS